MDYSMEFGMEFRLQAEHLKFLFDQMEFGIQTVLSGIQVVPSKGGTPCEFKLFRLKAELHAAVWRR